MICPEAKKKSFIAKPNMSPSAMTHVLDSNKNQDWAMYVREKDADSPWFDKKDLYAAQLKAMEAGIEAIGFVVVGEDGVMRSAVPGEECSWNDQALVGTDSDGCSLFVGQ